jgi:2-methylisocitrate lyase-like PEP mutase family enzyme
MDVRKPPDVLVPVAYGGPMSTTEEKRSQFLALHVKGTPLIMPNPWDRGSARLLASIGFKALATTSGGFASTLGRLDYSVSREEAIEHAAEIASAVDVPVSADLENGFSDEPAGVELTVRRAKEAGLAGCSIEDFTADEKASPIYDLALAVERVAAAAQAAHAGPDAGLVLTARAENYLRGRRDLVDTIERLQAYQQAGADVLYAPGISSLADIESIVGSVDRPLNVLVVPGTPSLSALARAGVARVSVGGAFNLVALGAVSRAARELLDQGSYSWLEQAGEGRREAKTAFS